MVASDSDTIVISPERVFAGIVAVIAVLVAASCTGQILKFFFGHDEVFGLVRLTYLNGEATIPAWYSSMALLACAGALAMVGATTRARLKGEGVYWFGLAILFVYLSVDEGAGIHELWGKPIKHHFAPGGFFRFAWVIPGMLAVAAVGATYLRFVLNLPAATRRLFILAACVFVGGAIGVEMISAKHFSVTGSHNFTHSLLITVEESAEMLGVAIFLYAVLRHLAAACGGRLSLDIGGLASDRTSQPVASPLQPLPASGQVTAVA